MKAVYAAYRGDEFLDLGTKEYLAERLGVTKGAIELFRSPSYRKRNPNGMAVLRIEDDDR